MRPSFGNACSHRSATARAARSQRLRTGPVSALLIEDDIYGDISFGEHRPRPFAAISAKADIILCRSTRMTDPKGGFVLWLELPAGFDADALYALAIRERICFVPGGLFTASDGYRNCLRLSCSHDWDARIERSVERLGELAGDMLA